VLVKKIAEGFMMARGEEGSLFQRGLAGKIKKEKCQEKLGGKRRHGIFLGGVT